VSADAVVSVRNWRAYGLAAAAGAMATSLVVWLVVDHATAQKPEPIEIRGERGTFDRLPDRDFTPAPKPAPPAVVSAPLPAAPPSPPKPPPVVAHVVPPKPMVSMFATLQDASAFVDDQKSGRGGAVPGAVPDAVETRPGQSEASRWLEKAGTKGADFVTSPFLPPISKYMLQAGTVIPATTLNAVNSDLPGDVVALINEDVLDTPTGRYVLIPASAKLFGRYSEDLRYGQTRAQVAWARILYPDGSSQNIGSMGGTDESGAAGIEGEVDRHPWSLAGAIGISAMLSIIGQAGTLLQGGGGQVAIGSIGADGAGRETQSIGREFVQRELNRPNTLILPQGTQVAVMLTRDVALPPYEAHPAEWAGR
jgi:type IV secretion system protein TrbI